MSYLADSTYGKDNVKFLKVKKDPSNPKLQQVMEATVKVLLRGNFDVSYTEADNSPIVPTDTVKNTILILARQNDTWPTEKFAAKLALHFTGKYSHVSGVSIKIYQERWVKYDVDGRPSQHSFVHQGPEKKIVELEYDKVNGPTHYKLSTSIKDLTVLKSTNSMFYDYNVCEYTTLKPTTDRVLSTDIFAVWDWSASKLGPLTAIAAGASDLVFDKVFNDARDITLDIFAKENSVSVQATMYNMGVAILAKAPQVEYVSYELPNKHYILFDLKWFQGLSNDNELFYPSPHPNGLIRCKVGRKTSKL
ncbi:(ZYRO0G09482g) [Zygosaccharomyces parabailii]|uniref:Uricase n=1 Tax=Zygosaccharomyces bailii (strain CLIB 213 / ATCC 58445 / CBS 680 / BCRC 21525 / NBRC 1098 / NCYC 1416 / NRRL Y-2227) TaxID=1333698 RepID=A0A8J2T5L0_ZYGB2|nr:(ZYRO0G09482g) [Zygosaccharomyces parabailii]CDF89441.1 ZYBA0S04-04390g1_1 [Zygosaccharomyces bailii CLIB 213]CDH08404.1 probable Uricase [Zygosaccharomyces bailii ISA1307]SJM85874.1 probable Uricase [Zygosaccharomyces bailii]